VDLINIETIILLIAIAGIAGFIDAIAGGGGLITLPALIWIGLPPISALATNKLQGSFGTLSASIHFIRSGHIQLKQFILPVSMSFIGGLSGSLSVGMVPNVFLETLIPVMLIGFALFFMFSPKITDDSRAAKITLPTFAFIFAFPIGFYDGFFGPGAGSFFTLAAIIYLGYGMTQSIASTKILNFSSNFAALILFSIGGHVWWQLGLILGIAQAFGAWLGSKMAIKHGSKLIKPIIVIVSIAASVKFLLT